MLATVIEKGPNDIGIEQYLNLIPIIRAQLAIGRSKRQRHSGNRWVEFARSFRAGWRCDSFESPTTPQLVPLDNLPLRVDRNAVGWKIRIAQRYIDTFHASGRFFRAQQNPGFARSGAAELGVETNVLVGVVKYQPTPAALFGRSD
jgi:hypothetical protein